MCLVGTRHLVETCYRVKKSASFMWIRIISWVVDWLNFGFVFCDGLIASYFFCRFILVLVSVLYIVFIFLPSGSPWNSIAGFDSLWSVSVFVASKGI